MTALEAALAELAAEEAKALAAELEHEIDYVMCEVTRPLTLDPAVVQALEQLARAA